jgi:tRNA threonylcarbamoyladenosine biosynthesis protein TsaB
MPYILHIESATKSCSVALSKAGNGIDVIEEHSENYIHGEKLAFFISQIFERNLLEIDNLSAVSISAGPGSYTGLRIGVSIAKGICYALSIPLIEIDTLKCYERCARLNNINNTLCAMIDARRMEVYSAIFSAEGDFIKQTSADILNEYSYVDYEPFVCIGDGIEKVKELWESRNIDFSKHVNLSAVGQVDLAFKKYQAEDFVDVAYYEPNYIKEFHTGS